MYTGVAMGVLVKSRGGHDKSIPVHCVRVRSKEWGIRGSRRGHVARQIEAAHPRPRCASAKLSRRRGGLRW
jgi:hypothetical protein